MISMNISRHFSFLNDEISTEVHLLYFHFLCKVVYNIDGIGAVYTRTKWISYVTSEMYVRY
jgi:hypothetical protein